MNLFSKFRRHLLKGNSAAKYITYAIGEIVLVVIGILIAVAINNANETKRENQLLNRYLKDYKNDLKIDSAVIASNLKLLDARKDTYDLVLSDSLDKTILMRNPNVFGLIFSYNPFKLQSKGYNQLKSHVSDNTKDMDSLVVSIVANHSTYNELLDSSIQRIGRDIDDNLTYLKNNKLWLSDFLSNNITPETIEYFVSADYKNRVAIHKTYVFGNLYAFMQAYQKYIEEMTKELDERLNEEE
ncbi:DUF6090 family protein [Winogradskyella flava]|uniref:Uncharacterized protein n=1 Tax=Winogradskyella flava TaxID=1884876 RepID=A0A842IPA8_9FLAO|nr:DUF6090 family protein [Winogradskyella flava]MBC2845062.1 hypothetical protein [Winogradskyella flava]